MYVLSSGSVLGERSVVLLLVHLFSRLSVKSLLNSFDALHYIKDGNVVCLLFVLSEFGWHGSSL
jgi:hypothetical protein